MKKRTLIILAIILLVFVLGEVALNLSESLKVSSSAASEMSFLACTKDTAKKIYYKNGDNAVTLTKENGGWTVNHEPADQTLVESFIAHLSSLKLGDIASKNKENYPRLGMNEAMAIQLSTICSEAKNKYFISPFQASYSSFYLRKDGEENVYSATSAIFSDLGKKADDWKKKIAATGEKKDKK